MAMKRTLVLLPDRLHEELKQAAASRSVSLAAYIRYHLSKHNRTIKQQQRRQAA